METLENSETLGLETVMSNLDQEQNPCLETLDGAPRFSSSSKEFTELVCVSGVCSKEGVGVAVDDVVDKEIDNVEVVGRVFGDRNFSEGVGGKILVSGEMGVIGSGNDCWNVTDVVADGNQGNECLLELDSGGKTAEAPGNEMPNGLGFVQEVCSTDKEIDELVMQEGIEEGDASQVNVVDSGNKIETSPAGISLYVDVFGPVDSVVRGGDSNLFEQGLFESSLSEEYLWKENIASLPDNRKNGSISEVQDCDIDKNAVDVVEEDVVEGDVVADQGYKFNVGDLVWAKLNTQFWWPGVICKHSGASNDAAKIEKKERLQIRLFGSGDVLWGWPSQLKPFHEYFEQMSTQSDSKSFRSSVEKAVDEIGRRAKLEMTCSCYPEKSIITSVAEGGSQLSKENACKRDELPVLQFEPKNLLARIKCFARDVGIPGMIESKAIQNRLSAFFCFIGHQQLPMHQLKPTSDAKSDDPNRVESGVISSKQRLKSRKRSSNKDPKDGNDKGVCTIISSEMKTPSPIKSSKSTKNKVKSVDYVNCGTDIKAEKSYESRERRKSKYLSFPYVDPGQVTKSLADLVENEVNDPVAVAVSRVREDKKTTDDSFVGPALKSHDKKSKNSSCGKRMGHNISIQDVINASSAEMLSKLQFTALDCLYPDESRPFNVWESFFSRFRTFAFRDFTPEDTVWKDFDNETSLPSTLLEVEIQTENLMEKEVSGEHQSTVEAPAAAPDVSKTAGIGSTANDLNIKSRQKSRKKKEKATPMGLNTTSTGSMSENITTSGSIVIDFQKIDPPESGSQSVPKKRKRKATGTPGFPEIKVIAALPDLNRRGAGPQLEGFSVADAVTVTVTPNKGKPEPKRKKEATSVNHSMTNGVGENDSIRTVEGLKEVEVVGPYSLQNIPELNKERTKEPAALLVNAEIAPKQQDGNNIAEPSSIAKQEGKKRKRTQKDTNVTSVIPDLNGNTSESRLQEAHLPEKCIPAEGEGEPQKRRRKKKTDTRLFDINLSAAEAQTNGEAMGIALLLKFSSEAPIPKKEDLMSTFSKFGTLKDSETQVVNDSATAQVVFINSSDARNAFRSLEKNSPFGPALVNYRLHVLLATAGVSEPDGSLNLHEAWPADDVKRPPKRRISKKPKNPVKPRIVTPPQGEGQEAPDLRFVRQNLQMMTSMLENAGDNVSPEMRAKLELEIKSLLNKVSSMVGASSS